MGRLSSNRIAVSVKLKTTCRQLSAPKVQTETVIEQLIEQEGLKEETDPSTTDMQRKLNGAKPKIEKFESREGCMQEGSDRISKADRTTEERY